MKDTHDFARKISVIVPVYNVEKFLAKCLDSLAAQTLPKEEMEVLLINDGTPDGSGAICERYAAQYNWIRYFSKENEGLSATRNYGLARAEGKYIIFLDSDDTFTPETLKSVVDVFDAHYDEVDLVTYRIQSYQSGKKVGSHYRYRFLTQSGVYDVNDFPFIVQTTINICVKNRRENNILFDTNPDFHHEDQKYCTEQLLTKGKIGFSAKGEYCYNRSNSESIMATCFYSYYLFESTTAWFESMFNQFESAVPRYIQALFLHDLNWKTRQSILMPTHYAPEQLQAAKDRLRALLQRVDDDIILAHPVIDAYYAQYFLRWKFGKEDVKFLAGPQELGILKNDLLLYTAKRVECFVTKFRLKDGTLRLVGFLKSPVFNYTEKPQLFLKINGRLTDELPLRESSWSYYKSKEKTNLFWAFHWDVPVENVMTLALTARLEGHYLETSLGFLTHSPFQPRYQRRHIFWDELEISCEGNVFSFCKATGKAQAAQQSKERRYYLANSIRALLLRERLKREAKRKGGRRIWLYYDCENVLRDNGYFQFIHDFEKRDGVERYYVVNDELDRRALLDKNARKRVLQFGSKKHQSLFVQAEKVITAFIEPANYNPFAAPQIPHVSDFFRYELVYLQHGVLHAHLPWKYSLDRLNLDKEVISTTFERRNLLENYGFTEDELLPTGMPRYDHIDRDAPPKRKILFAPSWRKYLIGRNDDGEWLPKHGSFKKSAFFQLSQALFAAPALAALLEEYDYTLEVQLHPILGFYKEHYSFPSERITFAQPGTPESDYAIFITDISSFVFDFAYLRRPILYFMPDMDLFRAGLNDYCALDLPLEDGLGPLTQTPEEAIAELRGLLERGCIAKEPFNQRAEGLFLELNNCREKIYQELIQA